MSAPSIALRRFRFGERIVLPAPAGPGAIAREAADYPAGGRTAIT
jgi:hypothetical protein